MNTEERLIRLILRRYTALGLHGQEALLLLHLVDLGGMKPTARLSSLADCMGLSVRHVSRLIAALVERGLLQTTPTVRPNGGRGENTFDLTPFLMACGDL